MRQTFSERVDAGKVTLLALPRSEEARAMKDNTGEHALSDSEGYSFKGLQIAGELAAEEMPGIPLIFFNVESDDSAEILRQAARTAPRQDHSGAVDAAAASGKQGGAEAIRAADKPKVGFKMSYCAFPTVSAMTAPRAPLIHCQRGCRRLSP